MPSVYDGPPAAAGDTLVGLHKALIAYQRNTLRHDGVEVAWHALEHSAGASIAAMVMGMIERLRRELRAAV